MKVIIDINDNKAAFIMELLRNFPFVKAKTISDEKALIIEGLKEAVDNLNMVKKGKVKAKPAKDLIDEL